MTILSISENSEAKNSYWAQFVENSFLKEKKNIFYLSIYARPKWCPFEDKCKLEFSLKISLKYPEIVSSADPKKEIGFN